ncbi:MAG: hypothetical protein U9R13_08150 [Campylobacterota bacterium]|nr:hypothetical protein [Campylobacterota bacterium]
MNIKVVGAIVAIAVLIFSISRCSSDRQGSTPSFVQASQLDSSIDTKRKGVFSKWLSALEHKKRIKNKYYRKTYPAYVEMDTLGNRRVLELALKPDFHWHVSAGHLLDEFPQMHIKQTMNNGMSLLSLFIIERDGFKVFTAVWVSNSVFSRESKKLLAKGIYPPEFE